MDLTFCVIPSEFFNDDGKYAFRVTMCTGNEDDGDFRKDKVLCDWSSREYMDDGLIRYEMHNIYNEDNREKKRFYYRDMGRLDGCNITNIQFVDDNMKVYNINRQSLESSLVTVGLHKYREIYHSDNYYAWIPKQMYMTPRETT